MTAVSIGKSGSVFAGGVVALVGLAVFINYVDRGLLPSAAPLLKDELHLSGTRIGVLISAFFWTYVPCQLLSGWMADRIGAYRTLAFGVGLWSLSTAAFGLASGVGVLLALRLALGVGESAAFPCASKIFADRVPIARLGAANATLALGLSLGPAFGAYFGGLTMAATGWRPAFVGFGVLSLLWLVPWLMVSGSAERGDRAANTARPIPLRLILRKRGLWGAGLGQFGGNYAFYFVVSWLPLFLVKYRGFSMGEMAALSGLIYLVYAASCAFSGWAGDAWMAAGASANRARKTFLVASGVICASALGVCAVSHGALTIASLFVAAIGFGFNSPNVFAAPQTLAGPRASARWVGLQNAMGNLAGICAPLITGALLDRTGDFRWPFAAAAIAALANIVGWGLIVPRLEPIDWEA